MSNDKVTKGFKVTPESKSHIEGLFAGSEFSDQGDFLLHMASLYEMQKLKNNEVAGYAKQLDELEFHSRRIVELYLAMIMTEQTGRIRLSDEHADRVAELSDIISGQQDELRGLSDDLKRAAQSSSDMQKHIEELERHAKGLQQANERGEELITEYKSRIDSFSGLLASQQEEVNSAKALQRELTELTKLTESRETEIQTIKNEHEHELRRRDEAHQDIISRHKREIDDIEYRAKLETEKALVTERRQLQDQMANERATHNVELRKLYADMNDVRQQLSNTLQAKAADKTQATKTDD